MLRRGKCLLSTCAVDVGGTPTSAETSSKACSVQNSRPAGFTYLTCSICGWVDLFSRAVYRDIVLDSELKITNTQFGTFAPFWQTLFRRSLRFPIKRYGSVDN